MDARYKNVVVILTTRSKDFRFIILSHYKNMCLWQTIPHYY